MTGSLYRVLHNREKVQRHSEKGRRLEKKKKKGER